MTMLTAGELQKGQWVDESAWADIPTGAMTEAGKTLLLALQLNNGREFIVTPGSQGFQVVQDAALVAGARVRFIVPGDAGTEWKLFFGKYAFGTSTALADHLDSFTYQNDVYDGTTHNYFTFNGCKIDRLTIEGTGPGKLLIFEMSFSCQYMEITATKAIATIQNVTTGANGAANATADIPWNGNSQINLAGGGLASWYPESFKFTILRNIQRQDGIVTGYDTKKYAVPIALNEGIREISFEGSLILEDMTYVNAKRNKTLVTQVTIPIGTDSLELDTGYFTGDDQPTIEQKENRENVKIMFGSLAVA